jgi:FAD binding domain
MAAFNGALDNRDNPALRRILTEAMPHTFRWLLSHGLRFYGPMPEPPHTKPRMHNVLPNSRAFVTRLERAARRAGVAIRTSTRVVALLSQEGRVVGVACERAAGTYRASATVLAAGDITSDPELKGRYMGPREAKIDGVNITATGDAQKLATALGARLLNGDLALGPEQRFVPPQRQSVLLWLPPWPLLAEPIAWSLDHMPARLLRPFIMSFVTTALAPSPELFEAGALLVNRAGARFTDELAAPAFDIAEQPDKIGFLLLDARTAKRSPPGRISSRRRPASPMLISTTIAATAATFMRARARSKSSLPGSACTRTRWRRAFRATTRPAAIGRNSAPGLTSCSAPCARCSSMPSAHSRSIASTACSARTISPSPACSPRARPARAVSCSRATATISPGLSPCRAGKNAAMMRL